MYNYIRPLDTENQKVLWKVGKENLRKWRDKPGTWNGRFSTIKMSIQFYINSYRFNVFTIKIPAGFFVEIDKVLLKFVWKGKRPRAATINLNKQVDLIYQIPGYITKL